MFIIRCLAAIFLINIRMFSLPLSRRGVALGVEFVRTRNGSPSIQHSNQFTHRLLLPPPFHLANVCFICFFFDCIFTRNSYFIIIYKTSKSEVKLFPTSIITIILSLEKPSKTESRVFSIYFYSPHFLLSTL